MNIQLKQRFKQFAKNECGNSSRLYEYLSLKIAEDEEIHDLCTFALDGQPIPNLLLGSIHYLLLNGNHHPLKEFYPSLVETPKKVEDSYPYFQDFCKKFRNEIIQLIHTKIVQTNEVRRCAYLYPCISYIYQKVNKPISLIEIGTSAGLQLLWDQYKYSYSTSETIYGNIKSDVLINSEVKDKGLINLPLLDKVPPVVDRYGIDLHVNDLSNKEDYLWLKALIWPEHFERRELFEKAVISMKENEINLIEADGIKILPEVVKKLSNDSILCIFHTHVANQIPVEGKQSLLKTIEGIGENRDVFHLYNNIWDRMLHLDYYIDRIKYEEVIGETEGHGKWFEWRI
ncbi:DUF2332 domain-containing protein [Bacillus sp. AFS088145]|uniref:DUF2332 domain-containing protein n=1 Tax=Bacillus sp. AFS088145 TaxID=2033514 RepID=UPI000BF3AC5D|nr:DUF2332 domain-containing protein [Bacillus sp. AFS088145]PFH91043.1 hypothetical protein COI44_02095 [Bacillus sp. AFS088145]